MSNPPRRSRQESCELLGLVDAEEIVRLADMVLATGATTRVTRRPETGSIVLQVREPVARRRFQLADMVVTTAELELEGEPGWALRPGADRLTTLAQAVCEAELARQGAIAPQIEARLAARAQERAEQRAQEWQELLPTVVEFEEVL